MHFHPFASPPPRSHPADLRARQDDLRRTLGEVTEVAGQCRARLSELAPQAAPDAGRAAGRGR